MHVFSAQALIAVQARQDLSNPISTDAQAPLAHRTDGTRKTQQIIHRHLKLWLEYMTDMPVNWLKTPKVRDYFVWLRTDYEPRQFSGDRRALSEKTVRNIYITLSAFFTWAVRELNVPNLMQDIPAPKFEAAPVEPFTKEQIEALLKACESCKEAQTTDRRKFTMRRATARRDQAIILTLVDTGLRASELSALKVGDVDLKTGNCMSNMVGSAVRKGAKAELSFW